MIYSSENHENVEHGSSMSGGGVLVSVIIPFYGAKKFLVEAIESAILQTEKNIEIIVINDGSPENIDDVVEMFGRDNRIRFEKQENHGASAARNIGISLARGEYIAFLDADDIWTPNKLQMQLNFMSKTSYKWSHCAYNRFFDGDMRKKKYFACKIWGDVYPLILFWCPLATPCVILRREIFEDKTLRFPEGKAYGEDSVLWRAIGEKYNLGYLPAPLAYVRLRIQKNKIGNAAYRAVVQMSERANFLKSWRFVLAHSNLLVFFMWLLPTIISFFGIKFYYVVSMCFGGEKAKEFIARFLYLPSYVIFKINAFLLSMFQRVNRDKK